MNWIQTKFKELEEAQRAEQERLAAEAREQNRRLALAAKAWEGLTAALRADIDEYNAHPMAKRKLELRVSQTPVVIEVYWKGTSRPLLQISRPAGEATFTYSILSARNSGPGQYGGEIVPAAENEFQFGASRERMQQDETVKLSPEQLSEELLSPALFP